MKLTDLNKKTSSAEQALTETYNVKFSAAKLNLSETKTMLRKVRSLIGESKQSKNFHENQTGHAYMKLVFMEQALRDHLQALLTNQPRTRIVVENEEVEKSQVVLAAQDMVDSIQKMIEDVSDMVVKELPALVNGIESEIGANEGQTFNQQAGEALNGLQQTLMQSKQTLQTALNGITGQGAEAPEAFGPAGDVPGSEMGAEAGAMPGGEMPAPGAEGGEMAAPEAAPAAPAAPEAPEGPEAEVGREKR